MRLPFPFPLAPASAKTLAFNLEEALSEGIVVGHEGEEMPPFTFSAQQIEALLAYLASVQCKAGVVRARAQPRTWRQNRRRLQKERSRSLDAPLAHADAASEH